MKMNCKPDGREILFNEEQIGPYPDHLLKRVDVPTNWIEGNEPKRKGHNDTAKATVERPKGRKPIYTTPIFKSINEVRQYLMGVSQNPNPVAEKQAPIPEDPRVRSRHLKSLAYFTGADAVGICQIPEYGKYLDTDGNPRGGKESVPFDGSEYKYAIVLVKRKDPVTTGASNGIDWIYNTCNHECYIQLYHQSETLARYLRRLGFQALASNFSNYVTVMTSMIIAAGLGESGRLGIAVNPFFGPNLKAACVLTNMELEPDKPIDFGLQEFCKTCGICSEVCPSKAISSDNDMVEYNGYRKFKMDYVQCVNMGVQGKTVCGRCANFCPWTRPDVGPEFYKDWDGDVEKLYESVRARAAYLRENNFNTDSYKTKRWWFDLIENEDGELVVPGGSKDTKQ